MKASKRKGLKLPLRQVYTSTHNDQSAERTPLLPHTSTPKTPYGKKFYLDLKKKIQSDQYSVFPLTCMHLITFILTMSIYIGILHVIIELVKKIPESNLSLHRGVWKNSYF